MASKKIKSATEYSDDINDRQQKENNKFSLKKNRFVEDLPVNSSMENIRNSFVNSVSGRFSGIACDNCEIELIHYGDIFSSNPPTRKHICLGCGRVYYLPMGPSTNVVAQKSVKKNK